MLKADFHIHTASDPMEKISHSEEELIDLAASQGYEVLSITNHGAVTHTEALQDYARERNILLLPGVEMVIEGKHVLMINARPEHTSLRDFQDLEEAREESLLIIAPHPYFPQPQCLNGQFERHLALFDAVEFSHYYHPWINFNKKAVKLCRKRGIPLCGSSDTHMLRQFNTTWSLIDGDKDPLSVIQATRAGRVQVVTKPLSLLEMLIVGYGIMRIS
ncbi:MAG: PHP-associated domain-containing protein [bacterium]|nr:PHP-associated domain-containing protein [bacterium]